MGDSQLFLDTFVVDNINAEKYDRVSRITAHSTDNADTQLELDVNTEIYPVARNDNIQLMLASTLNLDGTRDDGKGWRDVGRGEQSLADTWDYVCHGKIYRFQEGDADNMYVRLNVGGSWEDVDLLMILGRSKVFISFGGLLLYMQGPFKKLTPLRIDYVYLLMKK